MGLAAGQLAVVLIRSHAGHASASAHGTRPDQLSPSDPSACNLPLAAQAHRRDDDIAIVNAGMRFRLEQAAGEQLWAVGRCLTCSVWLQTAACSTLPAGADGWRVKRFHCAACRGAAYLALNAWLLVDD